MLPIAAEIASRLAHDHAQSALPSAPVVPDHVTPARAPRAPCRRQAAARVLRRLADRIEPAAAASRAVSDG